MLVRPIRSDIFLTGIRPYLVLSFVCALLYLPGISGIPSLDRDESRFAQSSKQMVESNNWVDIRFQKEPRYKKPVGIYWLQSLSVKLFSPHNYQAIWAYRLPSALAAWASILLTFDDGFYSNYQLNFTCLKPNGEPSRLSLIEICHEFIDFRKQVVTRRLKYELSILEKRLHILAGFVKIFNDLDKALKLIRSSKSRKEAHDKIRKYFKLDDDQINAILEFPLYRLVSLEIEKVIAEQQEKLKEKKKIVSILKSSKKISIEVRKEFEEIDEKYGDKRKTKFNARKTTGRGY